MKTKIINTIAVEFNAEEISALKRAASIVKNLYDEMSKRDNYVIEFEDYDELNFIYDCGDIELVSGFLSALANDNFSIE